MGPWNELDNGPEPQYTIIAEPGIDIEISTNKTSGELQFEKFKANIHGYFKPKSLAKDATKISVMLSSRWKLILQSGH